MRHVGFTSMGSPLFFVQDITSDIRLMYIQEGPRELGGYAFFKRCPRRSRPMAPFYDMERKFEFQEDVEDAIDLLRRGVPYEVVHEYEFGP
jgi:hypothetical protein